MTLPKLRAGQTAIDCIQLFQEGVPLILRHVIRKKMGLAIRFRRELLDGQRHRPHVNQRFEPILIKGFVATDLGSVLVALNWAAHQVLRKEQGLHLHKLERKPKLHSCLAAQLCEKLQSSRPMPVDRRELFQHALLS